MRDRSQARWLNTRHCGGTSAPAVGYRSRRPRLRLGGIRHAPKTPWAKPDLREFGPDTYETPFQRHQICQRNFFFHRAQREELDKEANLRLRRERPAAARKPRCRTSTVRTTTVLGPKSTSGRARRGCRSPPMGRISAMTPAAAEEADGRPGNSGCPVASDRTETLQAKSAPLQRGKYDPDAVAATRRHSRLAQYPAMTAMTAEDAV